MASRITVARLRFDRLACALILAAGLTAGCRSAGSTSSTRPDPATVAAGQKRAMEGIQNNPGMPPQVKANVLRQMQGKFTPSQPGVPPAAK